MAQIELDKYIAHRETDNARAEITYGEMGWIIEEIRITAKSGDLRHIRQEDIKKLTHQFPSKEEIKDRYGK